MYDFDFSLFICFIQDSNKQSINPLHPRLMDQLFGLWNSENGECLFHKGYDQVSKLLYVLYCLHLNNVTLPVPEIKKPTWNSCFFYSINEQNRCSSGLLHWVVSQCLQTASHVQGWTWSLPQWMLVPPSPSGQDGNGVLLRGRGRLMENHRTVG